MSKVQSQGISLGWWVCGGLSYEGVLAKNGWVVTGVIRISVSVRRCACGVLNSVKSGGVSRVSIEGQSVCPRKEYWQRMAGGYLWIGRVSKSVKARCW